MGEFVEMASTETESSVQPSSLEVEHGDNEELFRTGNEPARRSEMFRGKGPVVLVYLNAAMAAFHGALFGLTLGLGNLNLSFPVYDLSYDLEVTETSEGQRSWKLLPGGGAVVMDLNFTWMTACFLLSALFHFGNCVLWRPWYIQGILDCRCPSRWIEYTFSASLMSVLIAYGAGMNVLLLLVAVFFLTVTTMFFGHLTECMARPLKDGSAWQEPWYFRLQAHFLGYVPQLTAWFLIMYQFHRIAAGAESPDGSRMPKFVFGIVWGELFVFWSFGAIQLIFTLLSPRHYPYGELCYQVMSLASKGLLGLILIVNVLMLSKFEEIFD